MNDIKNFLEKQYDVIIIGAGMGGATLGYYLAKAGIKVLFCEKGRSCIGEKESLKGKPAEEYLDLVKQKKLTKPEILSRSGRCNEQMLDMTHKKIMSFYPFAGSGSGGSGSLYGMVLQRFWPEDFYPGTTFSDAVEADVPDSWPINYEDLKLHYKKIEALFNAKGELDPLRKENLDPIAPRNVFSKKDFVYQLYEYFEQQGLHPYQPPLACELIQDCLHCQGFLCPKQCKNDSLNKCLIPAIEEYGAELIDQCNIIKLEADETKVTGIVCQVNGETFTLKSDLVVLAAGALETPNLLLNSKNNTWPNGLANRSGLVGRNLMRNFYDLYFVFPKNKSSLIEGPKEIYFTDFYAKENSKLGIFQSFGHLSPAATIEGLQNDIENTVFRFMMPIFNLVKPLAIKLIEKFLISKSYILVSTMEDMPYHDNRVIPTSETDGKIGIKYKVHHYDLGRIKQFRKSLKKLLQPFKLFVLESAEDNKNFIALSCGTCRFGHEPEKSVLDANNKVHDLDNLYVVDSSFFPSNPGLNSGLTVAANASRVAEYLIKYKV